MNQDLLNCVYYSNGTLYWKYTLHNKCQKDSPLGSLNNLGYLRVQFNKKRYYLHRVIWEMFNGEIPQGFEVDHIDGNPSNNLITNLRLLTHNQNLHSSRKLTRNTSGILGVSWNPIKNKWEASVTIKGTRYRKWCTDLQEAQEYVFEIKKLATLVPEGGQYNASM